MSTTEVVSTVEQPRAEIVAAAREFAQTEIAPFAAEWDRTETFPRDALNKLAELGFMGLLIPEEYEGLGLDVLTYLCVIEEIAAADAGIAITLSVHNSLASGMLLAHGSEKQKSQWLPRMASGEVLGAFALSEPDSGSDAAGMKSTARLEGGSWVLNGAKAWVTNGDTAGLIVVMARTDTPSAPKGAHGISAFLVPAGTPGLVPGKPEDKLGLRASHTTGLALTNLRLSPEHLLGDEGKGFIYALKGLDRGRMGAAAQAIGIARAALEHSVRYAAERKQFEQALNQFQGIQFKLADMATRTAASRALLHEAARMAMRGETTTQFASMAKLFASESAMWVATQAVQIFGGYGYMRDYPVERLFRDAKVIEIYEGTSEIQRLVIARALQA